MRGFRGLTWCIWGRLKHGVNFLTSELGIYPSGAHGQNFFLLISSVESRFDGRISLHFVNVSVATTCTDNRNVINDNRNHYKLANQNYCE